MPPRRHVSILSLHYPPEPTGNAPYTGALAAGLARRDFATSAHVAHPHYPEWRVREGYGQWHRYEVLNGVAIHRRAHYVPSPPKGVRRLLSELSFGVRLIFGRWGRPDAVVAASPALFATALATLRIKLTPGRPRLLTWVQDLYSLGLTETGEATEAVAKITRWIEARTLKAADRVIVIHPRFAKFVTDELGVAPANVVVIRNWTHLTPATALDTGQSKRELGWPVDTLLAVHTGNMGAKQGLENIVEAARLADETDAPVLFILVGDGKERADLETKAQGISRIRFVDPLDDDNYRRALAAADILLVNEKVGVASMAVPSKLTSYFDAERPIIAATDAHGITAGEIKASGAGLVIPAGEPDALLKAILGLSRDPERSRAFGSRGRRYRDEILSEEAAIAAFEAQILEVLD